MKKTVIYILLWALMAIGSTSSAQEKFGIAAVVDNAVITHRDIENRMRLLFLDSGLSVNKDNSENLAALARQQLIEEVLQFQEAIRSGITLPNGAVAELIGNMEQQNNLPAGGMENVMRQNNIEYAHFARQQQVRLAWNIYLQRQLENSGGISDDEVMSYIESLKARQDGVEVNLQEIFLPYPSPLLAEKTKVLANDILRRLNTGADFATLARSFSASRSAAGGGDTGWLSVNLLADDIRTVVDGLSIGELSGTIETISGIAIIKLQGRRSLETSTDNLNEAQVRQRLQSQKIELLHRQAVHRLKGDAFIELR